MLKGLKSPLEATKALMVNTRDLSISLGNQLSPLLCQQPQLIPMIQSTKHWIEQHQRLFRV